MKGSLIFLRNLILILSSTQIKPVQATNVQQRGYSGETNCFVANLYIWNSEITQQRVNNEQGCLELCKKYPNCQAVMMDVHRQVCHVFASGYGTQQDYNNRYRSAERSCFGKTPPQDTGNLFQLVDSSGNYVTGQQRGLLLYNGNTLCNSTFNMTAAHAVCKLMGYRRAVDAVYGRMWKIQEAYKVFPHGLACSKQDWSSCQFVREGQVCNDHKRDLFLTCSGNRSPFTLVNFSGAQVSGQQQFLLLYNGGTVCGDHFSDTSAHAICRDMGYFGAKSWRMGESSWSLGSSEVEYHIALDDVSCTETDWTSCSYTTSHNCVHGKVIYLSCTFVRDYNDATDYTGGGTSSATAFITLVCIGLAVMVLRRNSQIEGLTKKYEETDALNKRLQEQLLKEQKNNSQSSPQSDESSPGEYQDVNGPD